MPATAFSFWLRLPSWGVLLVLGAAWRGSEGSFAALAGPEARRALAVMKGGSNHITVPITEGDYAGSTVTIDVAVDKERKIVASATCHGNCPANFDRHPVPTGDYLSVVLTADPGQQVSSNAWSTDKRTTNNLNGELGTNASMKMEANVGGKYEGLVDLGGKGEAGMSTNWKVGGSREWWRGANNSSTFTVTLVPNVKNHVINLHILVTDPPPAPRGIEVIRGLPYRKP